ncbi:MAG TPA: hypothetical protein VKN82_10910 [Desulfohalobiaceae bacterium]|nr:hypothetical protein [Desulfohalobiaceae bacterium]
MGFQSYPIDSPVYFWKLNEAFFKPVFSGEIHNHQPNQDGHDPLAWENKHCYTSKEKQNP